MFRVYFPHHQSRTFCDMYRDMPCTPEAFCSVHSRVIVRRTSFFLDAAITWSEPLEGAAQGARFFASPDETRDESAAGRVEVMESAMVVWFAAVQRGRRAAECAWDGRPARAG